MKVGKEALNKYIAAVAAIEADLVRRICVQRYFIVANAQEMFVFILILSLPLGEELTG